MLMGSCKPAYNLYQLFGLLKKAKGQESCCNPSLYFFWVLFSYIALIGLGG